MDISISLSNSEKAEVYRHALKTNERQLLSFVLSNGYDPDTFSVGSMPEEYAEESSPSHNFYKEIHRIIKSIDLIKSKISELEK